MCHLELFCIFAFKLSYNEKKNSDMDGLYIYSFFHMKIGSTSFGEVCLIKSCLFLFMSIFTCYKI